MAFGNEELMHECFPKHSPIGTAKNEIRQRNRKRNIKRGVSMERSVAGLSKYNNNKHNIIIFYKI